MSNQAFIELTFSKETKKIFSDFVQKIIPKEFIYSSDEVSHIKGDMTKTLHCTVLFGLDRFQIDNPELQEVVSQNKFSEIALGNLFFFEGYQNMYKILALEILDSNKALEKFSKKLEQYSTRSPREFRPHLTLAYVTNEYELPSDLPEIPKSIEVQDTRITLVSEFLREVNSTD